MLAACCFSVGADSERRPNANSSLPARIFVPTARAAPTGPRAVPCGYCPKSSASQMLNQLPFELFRPVMLTVTVFPLTGAKVRSQ